MTTKIGRSALRAVKSWDVPPVAPIEARESRVMAVDACPAAQLATARPLLAPAAMAALIQVQERVYGPAESHYRMRLAA